MKSVAASSFVLIIIAALIGLRPAFGHAPTCNQSIIPRCVYFPATGFATGTELPRDLFKHLNWDRPHDIAAVISALERMNTNGEFGDWIDLPTSRGA